MRGHDRTSVRLPKRGGEINCHGTCGLDIARRRGAGVTQVHGISTTRGWERRPIIESVDGKRRATAHPMVSERTREEPAPSWRLSSLLTENHPVTECRRRTRDRPPEPCRRLPKGGRPPFELASGRISTGHMVQTLCLRNWGLIGVVMVVLTAAGCGGNEPSDRPSDCTGDEYFNQRTERCQPCPVYDKPSCKPGCGFEITEDRNGCPRPTCDSECDTCGPGAFYAVEQGACQRCPETPNCRQYDCEGELRVTEPYSSTCPPPDTYACGACTRPEQGCTTGEQGQCVDAPDAMP